MSNKRQIAFCWANKNWRKLEKQCSHNFGDKHAAPSMSSVIANKFRLDGRTASDIVSSLSISYGINSR